VLQQSTCQLLRIRRSGSGQGGRSRFVADTNSVSHSSGRPQARANITDSILSRQLFSSDCNGGVFLDPLASELDGFIRCQPGPVRAARAECHPDRFTVDVLFDREGRALRHGLALCGLIEVFSGPPGRFLVCRGTGPLLQCDRDIVICSAAFLPHPSGAPQPENRVRCRIAENSAWKRPRRVIGATARLFILIRTQTCGPARTRQPHPSARDSRTAGRSGRAPERSHRGPPPPGPRPRTPCAARR
jgi:hypothetical protein